MTDSKRKKRPTDTNQLAKFIVDVATDNLPEPDEPTAIEAAKRKAGKKGGAARAASLTPEERSEIASIAANSRWKKRSD